MQSSRRFELIYDVTIPDIPEKAKWLNIWTPFPTDMPFQEIHSIDVEATCDYEVNFDSKYGNAILHATARIETTTPVNIKIIAQATRHEWSQSKAIKSTNCGNLPINHSHFNRQLAENRHVKITSDISAIALSIAKENHSSLGLARAIYDYVVSTMDYDKSVDGWGQGDSEFACAIGKGNCTDFHSLFLALARAANLPAQFEIGLAFPAGMQEGDITMYKCGYHCWATVFIQGIGWIPVDCSEAAQHEELNDYYFGSIDANRFMLSRGRDIDLSPKQIGEAQNFFTEPYVETDAGTPVYSEKKLAFRDL